MKNKKKIWYLGYAITVGIAVFLYLSDLSQALDVVLGILLAVVFSVSHVQLLHEKMLATDSDYRAAVMDERNITIKEKAGNITNMVNVVLMGCVTAVFIVMDYIVPAVIVGMVVFVQPLILIAVSSRIEKRV